MNHQKPLILEGELQVGWNETLVLLVDKKPIHLIDAIARYLDENNKKVRLTIEYII